MTVSEAGNMLGGARYTLTWVLKAKSGVSPAMALKLEALEWSSAAFGMRLQSHYDLAQARKRLQAKTRAGYPPTSQGR